MDDGSLMMTEIWIPVHGFSDYEVSNAGNVRRRTNARTNLAGRVLNPWMESNGYLRVALRNGNVTTKMWAHRVVAIAFHGQPPTSSHEVAHNDGVKTNNAATNLRWALRQENSDDKFRHGTVPTGERAHRSKLSESTVLAIRSEPHTGYGFYVWLGRKYNLSSGVARGVYLGDRWRHDGGKFGVPIVCRSLTNKQIAEIRATPYMGRGTYARLARDYGVDRNTIRDVALGRKWKHVGTSNE